MCCFFFKKKKTLECQYSYINILWCCYVILQTFVIPYYIENFKYKSTMYYLQPLECHVYSDQDSRKQILKPQDLLQPMNLQILSTIFIAYRVSNKTKGNLKIAANHSSRKLTFQMVLSKKCYLHQKFQCFNAICIVQHSRDLTDRF